MTIRSTRDGELVSVVIPAYNAEGTIDETLASVREQTHRALEILVVDDGSSDATAARVEAHAAADPRVRLIRQENGGVAKARNTAIAAAKGAFIAPIDADDLWRPDKIERQLRAIVEGGAEVGLVYCWSSTIDAHGLVTSQDDTPGYDGDVIPLLLYGNFVGNGSCALMRKDAVLAVGGYDPSLRARGGQGCEDWKLYLSLARTHRFGVVLDYLVGYRRLPEAMSADIPQMLRSDALVRAEMRNAFVHHSKELDRGRWLYISWLLEREIESGTWERCLALLAIAEKEDDNMLRAATRKGRLRARFALRRLKARPVRGTPGRPFLAPQLGEIAA